MKRGFERGRQQAFYDLEYSGIVVTNGDALFHAWESPEMPERAYAIITLDKRVGRKKAMPVPWRI